MVGPATRREKKRLQPPHYPRSALQILTLLVFSNSLPMARLGCLDRASFESAVVSNTGLAWRRVFGAGRDPKRPSRIIKVDSSNRARLLAWRSWGGNRGTIAWYSAIASLTGPVSSVEYTVLDPSSVNFILRFTATVLRTMFLTDRAAVNLRRVRAIPISIGIVLVIQILGS